jgi:hypothetical protein
VHTEQPRFAVAFGIVGGTLVETPHHLARQLQRRHR